MGDKLKEEDRHRLFDLWCKLQEEMVTLHQAGAMLYKVNHADAQAANRAIDSVVAVKKLEADSIKMELDADRVRVV